MTLTVLPMGPAAALVETGSTSPAKLAAHAERHGVRPGHAGVIEVVPAATTLLVDCVDAEALDAALMIIRRLAQPPTRSGDTITAPAAPADSADAPVVIGVRFDGPDLDAVADAIGRGPHEVVDSICSTVLEVAFCGFAPGFAYLAGLDPDLHLARRDHPRPRVPAGSFAIAAGYAAVYPTSSPGGWHLLGTTSFEVWSLGRRPPAALRPGMRVRVVSEASEQASA